MSTAQGAAERVTCPVCGRPNVALTRTGKIHQHNDRGATAVARGRRGSPFARELCPASGIAPEAVASAVAQEVTQ